MKKHLFLLISLFAICLGAAAQSSGFDKLDEWTHTWKEAQQTFFGYPVNEVSALHGFYEWYVASGMDVVNINNAGDPMSGEDANWSSHAFEREVIEFFAPLYGFEKDKAWGIVTHSGTDGNNHGIYFGAKYLYNKTGKMPVVYVSDEAHYSNLRICDLQNLDVRLIKSDAMGRMIPEELDKALDHTRPVLMVYAMGSTFKGAIDDMDALNAVLDKYPDLEVFRHVDAALFGGYLPFTEHKDMVNRHKMRYDAIAISGHKFFGIDSPCGLFLCTRETYDNQNNFNVTYLNGNMRMINCSRDAVQPLKFWWLIQTVGYDNWAKQANQMMECTAYLKQQLDKIGWPCWVNEYSNTVFFRRPSKDIVEKYNLAQGYDARFGGELAHIVVMQHVTPQKIDLFIRALQSPRASWAKGADLSWLSEMEADGVKFYVQGDDVQGTKEADCMALLRGYGMNAVRLRVWVNHKTGWSNIPDMLSLAKRAAAMGLRIMIDIHYSDFFADPNHQSIPESWQAYDYPTMLEAVRTHTLDVLSTLKQAGVAPEWVQIGNETPNGMLWPMGKVEKPTPTRSKGKETEEAWDRYAGFTAAGYKAAKEVFPEITVLVHVDNAYEQRDWFWQSMKEHGGQWDMIGLSHYPMMSAWNGGKSWQEMNALAEANIRRLAEQWHCPVMIAEVGTFANSPESATVMADFLQRIRAIDGCAGIFYWEPQVYGGWRPAEYIPLGWGSYDMGAFTPEGHPNEALQQMLR